jgi:transcriptional regulator with GAF, ATPase, and Fis domain
MTTSPAQAFADAAAAMVNQDDVADTLAKLMSSCADLTSADALGLLIRTAAGELEMLSATSHQAAELELYQLQHDCGPCLDSIRTGRPLSAVAPEDIVERWGAVGEAITTAGYQSVHTAPLRWHGETIGALNAFRKTLDQVSADEMLLFQAFADVATIVIVQTTELTVEQLSSRIDAALEGRTVIEQAKGVLAQYKGVDMATAYQLLRARGDEQNQTLTEVAARILQEAAQR